MGKGEWCQRNSSVRDPLGVSPGNVNNLNSYNFTKDSLLTAHLCLKDLHIETFKDGPWGRNRGGKNIWWTWKRTQHRVSDVAFRQLAFQTKKRAIKSCCRVDSQNLPFLTLGVRLWSTLSAKPKMVTVGSLFPLRKECILSLTPSWGLWRPHGGPSSPITTGQNNKIVPVTPENSTPEHCCYNESSYWRQFWDFIDLKNCRLSATS